MSLAQVPVEPMPPTPRKRSNRGRKALSPGERRDVIISVACTPAEAVTIKARAQAAGLTPPAYLRACEVNTASNGFVETVQKVE